MCRWRSFARIASCVAVGAAVGWAANAQVTASQAPESGPPPRQEICPLQLDIDLSASRQRTPFVSAPAGATATFTTDRYVCDKARVESVRISKLQERPREVQIEVAANLATEWVRQDVNLTLQFLVDGKVQREDSWRSLTIGTTEGGAAYIPFGGSSPKTRSLKWWVQRKDFETWFQTGAKPSVRVRLEVVK